MLNKQQRKFRKEAKKLHNEGAFEEVYQSSSKPFKKRFSRVTLMTIFFLSLFLTYNLISERETKQESIIIYFSHHSIKDSQMNDPFISLSSQISLLDDQDFNSFFVFLKKYEREMEQLNHDLNNINVPSVLEEFHKMKQNRFEETLKAVEDMISKLKREDITSVEINDIFNSLEVSYKEELSVLSKVMGEENMEYTIMNGMILFPVEFFVKYMD